MPRRRTATDEIRTVQRATLRHLTARAQLDRAIVDAHNAGLSLRQIANAASMSPETVRTITRNTP